MKFCGIDLHSNNSVLVITDEMDKRLVTRRCPNDIDIALVIDALRERVLQKGRTPAVENVALFHKYFLDNFF